MVVEHTFITVREADVVMPEALRALNQLGFTQPPSGFSVGLETWSEIQLRRGAKTAAKAKSVAELPQTILVQFDRGRITVAASIEGSRAFGRSGRILRTEDESKMSAHRDLLLALVTGLESLMAHGAEVQLAFGSLQTVEVQTKAAARKRRNKQIIILVIFIVVVAIAVALVVTAADR